MTTFYITTPIYYVNDVPHLGTAYTTIAADVLARYHRAQGHDTWFLTGTDEHGQKIEQTAKEQNKTPLDLANTVVNRFETTWKNLNITHNDFIRTTQDRHKTVVADIWNRLVDAGDIYLGEYKGSYCIRCESFYTEGQLIDKKLCPIHNSEISRISESSYFFRLSKYQDRLLEHFNNYPDFVQPESYKNEIISFIKTGLRDLSISRTSFQWGITTPTDDKHVIYVWLDALTNYISALGGPGTDAYKQFWPAQIHLIGKDILRFHAVYWPCFLFATNLPLPKTILTHGWWNVRGKKISKSLPATQVDPNHIVSELSSDALRYFLLREIPLGLDGDFSYETLIDRYNADLANDLGNLLQRTLSMTVKFCDGSVPLPSNHLPSISLDEEINQTTKHFDNNAPSLALETIWAIIRKTNRYIDSNKPWTLAKDPTNQDTVNHIMSTALNTLYYVAQLIAPVLPDTSITIQNKLGIEHPTVSWPQTPLSSHAIESNNTIECGSPLFPRIDQTRKEDLIAIWSNESK